jgi:YesN/AraC family two-component response regulator
MTISKRILVVDDEERVLFILENALKKLGGNIEIVTANDGGEALEQVHKSPFDLLITDLRMPVMDGIDLTQAIRELSPETVIVWITAYDTFAVSSEAGRLGVRCCLEKPLEIGAIRAAAREALENGSKRESG